MFEVKFRTEKGMWESRPVMEIWHKGEIIGEHYEGGEPEDNTFGRDLSWIPDALMDAYAKGVADGVKTLSKNIRRFMEKN